MCRVHLPPMHVSHSRQRSLCARRPISPARLSYVGSPLVKNLAVFAWARLGYLSTNLSLALLERALSPRSWGSSSPFQALARKMATPEVGSDGHMNLREHKEAGAAVRDLAASGALDKCTSLDLEYGGGVGDATLALVGDHGGAAALAEPERMSRLHGRGVAEHSAGLHLPHESQSVLEREDHGRVRLPGTRRARRPRARPQVPEDR